ncbi:MAG TPA: hypothetical protein VG294_10635 [Solirubrobacteraceae bacterium]|jgi:hypothetical protein|nr:hypothetical protein [Solirubrobacteraceae bacterium]
MSRERPGSDRWNSRTRVRHKLDVAFRFAARSISSKRTGSLSVTLGLDQAVPLEPQSPFSGIRVRPFWH